MNLDQEAAAALGISSEALDRVRQRDGQTFGEALAEAGLVEGAAFARALASAACLPFAPALPVLPARELLAGLPMPYARRHLVLPLAREDHRLAVAVANPAALAPLDDLRFLFQARLRPLVVPAPALRDAITRAYDAAASSASDAMEAMAGAGVVLELPEGADPLHAPSDGSLDLLEAGDEAPVIRLVNALLFEAVKAGASDIHLEPFERTTAVRFRIDGILHDVLAPPARVHATLAARVKIMAGLDIAERRLPQDGRIRLRVAGRDIDVRVSLVPTGFGERVVLRLLDRAAALLDLPELGLAPAAAAVLDRLLAQSHGIILVTGPTGSGKTTTLYAALQRLRTGERNIMTIEDPVEYQLRGIGQIQVNPRIDLTFASGLRAVLRQDPDVILLGEIRDRETVEIALQAALTGHLVFSTLHTNDACAAVTRLLDMGVEPFLIASAVRAVLAQRLVRRRCTACATGCTACRGTGYRGRTGIHELLVVDDAIRALVMARTDANTRHASIMNGTGQRSMSSSSSTTRSAPSSWRGPMRPPFVVARRRTAWQRSAMMGWPRCAKASRRWPRCSAQRRTRADARLRIPGAHRGRPRPARRHRRRERARRLAGAPEPGCLPDRAGRGTGHPPRRTAGSRGSRARGRDARPRHPRRGRGAGHRGARGGGRRDRAAGAGECVHTCARAAPRGRAAGRRARRESRRVRAPLLRRRAGRRGERRAARRAAAARGPCRGPQLGRGCVRRSPTRRSWCSRTWPSSPSSSPGWCRR